MGIGGKLLKYFIVIALAPFTFGLSIPLFLWYKYVKLWFIFYFKMLYLIIRLPIWLFIQLPLHYIGVSAHKVSNFFSKGYGLIMVHKKRYGLLFAASFTFMIYSFLPREADELLSFMTDATLIMPFLVLIPFLIVFGIASLSARFSASDLAQKEMPGGLNTGTKARTAQAATAAAAAGQVGMKAYNNKEEIKAAGEAASDAAEALPGDMIAVIEDMPMLGNFISAGGEAAAAEAGGAAAAEAGGLTIAGISGGPIILALLAVILLGIIGWIIMTIVMTAWLWGQISIVLPQIIGPIAGALGLGAAYGNWIGTVTANQYLPQVNLESEMRVIEQAGARVGCVLEGPACLRQWRLNNTVRPGSEDVGEKYRLSIDQFSAGGAGNLDVAYKQRGYNVPISFLVSNTRHGLKGIPANDVQYRIRIVDADRSGRNAYCTTGSNNGDGWKEVSPDFGQQGEILPGTSFSPLVQNLDGLTLDECEMLQPAAGETRTGKLEVKYDYSSQSTLYFDAMSREHMRSEGINPGFKKSETADTPVETYINVNSPVLFSERDGERTAIPFRARVGTGTDQLDIEYRIRPDDFTVIDSSKTTSGDSCRGLTNVGNNRYELSDRAKERINNRYENGEWFDGATSPSPARCTFRLEEEELGSISQTGETLTMRADANYTIIIQQTTDPFEVVNTRCTSINCPVLFWLEPGEFENIMSGIERTDGSGQLTQGYLNYKRARCDGIDAGDGCSAAEEYDSNYGTESSQVYGGIDQDDLALHKSVLNSDAADGIFSCYVRSQGPDLIDDSQAIGLQESNLEEVNRQGTLKYQKMINYTAGEWNVMNYDQTFSRSGGIPWVAEVEIEGTYRPQGCRDGKPVYEVESSKLDASGVIPWAGGLITPG